MASSKFEIRCDDSSISLFIEGTDEMQWTIQWQDIVEISAWKRDLFSVDLICMGFRWAGSDVFKEVDEEMKGWDRLQIEIQCRFGVVESEWWRDVAMPPFATQWTVLWKLDTDE